MERTVNFDQHGFFKDYYLNGKFIGNLKAEKDREVMGYGGRRSETLTEAVLLSNGKKIKAGAEVVTELQAICGTMK